MLTDLPVLMLYDVTVQGSSITKSYKISITIHKHLIFCLKIALSMYLNPSFLQRMTYKSGRRPSKKICYKVNARNSHRENLVRKLKFNASHHFFSLICTFNGDTYIIVTWTKICMHTVLLLCRPGIY